MTRRWTGSASVRLRSAGMLNLPKPFATLSVDVGRATLVVRPTAYTRGLPGSPWTLAPADAAEIFPVRATGLKRGVGFARPGQRAYYFWCGRAQDTVLAALEEAGFVVSQQERRPEYR
ncbi:hypothetical protein acdb102_34750 [Acidothermaceae bacterium B102]|nr:hypothetical protein acdb102_34750 [Acidothermaceae bacterium B102]